MTATKLACAAAIIAAAGFHAPEASAEPRFAVRQGAPCKLCHVNPTGGGMRTRFGRNIFEKKYLDMEIVEDGSFGFSPEVTEWLAFGGDFRLAFIGQPENAEPVIDAMNPPRTPPVGLFVETETPYTFFPMQADLYVSAQVGEHLTFALDLGAQGSFETYALLHDLPLDLYVKAGYFVSPYGTKFPNHTAAVRQPFGFDPRGKDAGLEVGMFPGPFELSLAVQNGELSGIVRDQESGFSFTGRMALRLELGPLNLTVGGSGQRISTDLEVDDGQGGLREATSIEYRFGPFLYASLGRFTYLGEAGVLLKQDGSTPDAQGQPTESGYFVSYQELNFLIVQGLDLRFTYEFLDRDIKTTEPEADVVHRVGATLSMFPLEFAGIDIFARYYIAREDRAENGQMEIVAFVHLFF